MTRRKIMIFALLVAVLLPATASRADAQDLSRRGRMLRLLNQTRRAHGLPIFRLNLSLSRYATTHSRQMASSRTLFHTSDLYSKVRSYGPSRWGENIGYAGRLRLLRTLWMNSAPHRHNILNGGFRKIGIGIVRARGVFWVTTIFYGG
jgi:uncharacterized protein YkwD